MQPFNLSQTEEFLRARDIRLTKKELLTTSQLASGGRSSQCIQELVESDFIVYSVPFAKKSSNGNYILVDEYSLFYLRWIESITKQGSFKLDEHY